MQCRRCKPAILLLFPLIMAGALFGCLTTGGQKGRGPIASFSFPALSNPVLEKNVDGLIIEQGEPKLILVVLPPGTDKKKLIANIALGTKAAITVVSGDQRVVQTNGITENDFSSPVVYSIEIPGESEPWRYRVIVREAETNARLAQITLPPGAKLSPAFSPTVDQYTIEVPFAWKSVNVAALAQSRNVQSISIGSGTSPSPLAVSQIDFSHGQETGFQIKVVAEDGVSTTKCSFTLKRAAADKDAYLVFLDIDGAFLSQPFSPKRFKYDATIPYDVNDITVHVKTESPLSTISLSVARVNSAGAATTDTIQPDSEPGKYRLSFSTTEHPTLTFTITAQDGSLQKYEVTILRDEPDSNNKLSDLSVEGATLSPKFTPDTLAYTAEALFTSRQLILHVMPQHKSASIAAHISRVTDSPDAAPQVLPVYLGDQRGVQMDFNSGDMRAVSIIVTAQNGETLSYSLLVRRAAPDRDALLASLTPSIGTLKPVFSPMVDTYTLRVPSDTTRIQLTATAESERATVTSSSTVDSTEGPKTVVSSEIESGQKISIVILVIAEDGTPKLYQVQVAADAS
jgi:hypothetical protein